jgi:hypothetical protein
LDEGETRFSSTCHANVSYPGHAGLRASIPAGGSLRLLRNSDAADLDGEDGLQE